ncbi:MAG: hypothetical protein ACM3X6_13115 [Patescibacteria group bacterium]
MSNEENAKKAARFLRALAARLEERPEFFEGFDLEVPPAPAPRKRAAPAPPALDVFGLFFAEGAGGLRSRLEMLEVRDLKAVISGHGLDPTGLARNWRKKEKLVDLIVERAEARGKKGEVFRA